MRILYLGHLTPGATCLMRLRALEDLGHHVVGIPATKEGRLTLWERVRWKLGCPPDWRGENQAILKALETSAFDILWIDKGLSIRPATLRQVRSMCPNLLIAGYSPDDMGSRHNQSRYFVQGLRYYDIYFTTKTYNVPELKQLGVPRAEFSPNAYDPATHYPVELTPDEKRRLTCDVGFVGTYERDRAETIVWLANQGIPVRIHGTHWQRFDKLDQLKEPVGPPFFGVEYSKAICAASINLCFLRKANRDLQTQRSVEIPACGAFMLAERTDEHLGLFEEGKEAEYFSSRQELLDKIRYYLANPQERQRIAEAGRRRCIEGGYSYKERMRVMLEQAKGQAT